MARPKSIDPKRHRLELRLTDDELDNIEYVAHTLGMTKSEAIVETMTYRADELYRSRELLRGTTSP